MEKQELLARQNTIIEQLKPFCAEKLNEEYFLLSEKLIKKLGRKRQPPFETGQLNIWAASVIHTIATVNFLFDRSNEHYISVDDISIFFGANKSTVTGKSKQIRDLLKIRQFDEEFSCQKLNESNPFTNLIMVNGFVVSANLLKK